MSVYYYETNEYLNEYTKEFHYEECDSYCEECGKKNKTLYYTLFKEYDKKTGKNLVIKEIVCVNSGKPSFFILGGLFVTKRTGCYIANKCKKLVCKHKKIGKYFKACVDCGESFDYSSYGY